MSCYVLSRSSKHSLMKPYVTKHVCALLIFMSNCFVPDFFQLKSFFTSYCHALIILYAPASLVVLYVRLTSACIYNIINIYYCHLHSCLDCPLWKLGKFRHDTSNCKTWLQYILFIHKFSYRYWWCIELNVQIRIIQSNVIVIAYNRLSVIPHRNGNTLLNPCVGEYIWIKCSVNKM